MESLNLDDLKIFVEKNIGDFHKRRVGRLCTLKLSQVLKRKNPYLFKAKNILTAQELIKSLLDAHLSSQEEIIFGEFLEKLAIYICCKVNKGKISNIKGIDLEFCKEEVFYILTIKSGPNWGNSSQIIKMKENFNNAKRILQTSKQNLNIQAVNGCCYGQENKLEKDGYLKLCGQAFWQFISGDANLFVDIIKPLGYRAKDRNEEFTMEYGRILNRFTNSFYQEYCKDGIIDWEKLVRFNSEMKH